MKTEIGSLLPLFVDQEYNNNIKNHKDKENLGQSWMEIPV